MKPLRTFLRRDLGRLVYKYSKKARMFGIDIDFAYGKGNVEYFKRCPFNYLLINDPVNTDGKITYDIFKKSMDFLAKEFDRIYF